MSQENMAGPEPGAMKVAVTGASGFIGQNLCQALIDEGYDVNGLVSPHADAMFLKQIGVEVFRGELRDKQIIGKLLGGVNGVFHLAGIVGHFFKPDSAYWDVNVTATKELLEACEARGIERFIYCSTTDVHGHIANPPADEGSPMATDDIYQITKEHGERAVLAHNGKKGLTTTVLRLSKVYGPGDMRGFVIFKAIADGSFTIFGDGENHIHPVYISDAVDALMLAQSSDKSAGRVYIIAGQESLKLNRMAEIIAGAADRDVDVRHFPRSVFKGYSWMCETVCSFFRVEPPMSRRYVDIFVKNHEYKIGRARDELGYLPKVGLEQGARMTFDWYRDKGLL